MTATCPPAPASAYGRPLTQLARELDKHLATLHRWRSHGVLDASGIRRRLPMTRVGGRWYVRDADLSEFFAVLAVDGSTPASSQDRQSTRSSSDEFTARELDAIGI